MTSRRPVNSIVGPLALGQLMRRITKANCFCVLAAIAVVLCVGLFFSIPIQFQPRRWENPPGWQKSADGGRSYIGIFVLTKGESTDDGSLGIKLLNITSKPCPGTAVCMTPLDAKATLRFYKPTDGSVVCEPTLESSSTSYSTSAVCPGLPFTDIAVREVNTRDEWATILLYNWDNAQRAE
jgi:hypothetical protein